MGGLESLSAALGRSYDRNLQIEPLEDRRPCSRSRFRRPAVIQTDKLEYLPGNMATVTAGGFQPGETVDLHVINTEPATAGQPSHDLTPHHATSTPIAHARLTQPEIDPGEGIGYPSEKYADGISTPTIDAHGDKSRRPARITQRPERVSPKTATGALAGQPNLSWTRSADSHGDFNTKWLCTSECLGANLEIDAKGEASGLTASEKYADGCISGPTALGTKASSSASANLTSNALSAAVATGNTVIVTVAMTSNTGTVTVTDTSGNTYTQDASEPNSGNVRTLIFSAPVTTALSTISTVTVTFGTSPSSKAMSICYFSGLATASYKDQSSVATGSSLTPNSGTTAATSQPNELIIGAFGANFSNNSFTAGTASGYTALAAASVSTFGLNLDPEYQVVSSTGTYAANGTYSAGFGTPSWSAAIVTYKAINLTTTTGVALTTGTTPSTYGTSLTYTATVNSTSGVPTGTVAFYDGSTLLDLRFDLSGSVGNMTRPRLLRLRAWGAGLHSRSTPCTRQAVRSWEATVRI